MTTRWADLLQRPSLLAAAVALAFTAAYTVAVGSAGGERAPVPQRAAAVTAPRTTIAALRTVAPLPALRRVEPPPPPAPVATALPAPSPVPAVAPTPSPVPTATPMPVVTATPTPPPPAATAPEPAPPQPTPAPTFDSSG